MVARPDRGRGMGRAPNAQGAAHNLLHGQFRLHRAVVIENSRAEKLALQLDYCKLMGAERALGDNQPDTSGRWRNCRPQRMGSSRFRRFSPRRNRCKRCVRCRTKGPGTVPLWLGGKTLPVPCFPYRRGPGRLAVTTKTSVATGGSGSIHHVSERGPVRRA